MEVRNALPDDYAAFAAISGEVGQLHHEAHPNLLKPHRPTEAEYLEALRTGGILLAVDSGEVVGILNYRIIDVPESEYVYAHRVLHIDEMGVSSGHRRKGIGEVLMQHVSDIASAHGVSRMKLLVWSFNEGATAFYRRMGYDAQSVSMSRDVE